MRITFNTDLKPLAALLIAALSCSAPGAGAGALYKWIDEEGQVRYSDRMPPSEVKREHHQLNKQGVVVSTTEAAKTEEQLAVEAEAKRLEEERQAEEARQRAIQAQKDQVLLMTFSSEKEIDLARADRIEVVDSVIRLINKSIATTQEKLDKLEAEAEQNFTSQGKDIPGGLAQKIEHFSRKIESRYTQLGLKLNEKDKINRQFNEDMARYRLLKSEAQKPQAQN